MTERHSDVIDELNNRIQEVEAYNFITRDSELQREACDKIDALLGQLSGLKGEAIAILDENMANTLLGFECVARYLKASITMWILLKAGDPDEAWHKLVDAQGELADAARAAPGFAHAAEIAENMLAIEKLIFPPQKFTSWGIVFRSRLCSICRGEYGEGDCTHLVGKPYMGEICHTRVLEFERADHLAFVTHPADKHSRVVSFSVPSGRKNRMTLKVEPAADDDPGTVAIGESAGEPYLIAQHISKPFHDV